MLDRPLRVAVIGGGPAGACAAETLAKGGIETTLIERKLDNCKVFRTFTCTRLCPPPVFALMQLMLPYCRTSRKICYDCAPAGCPGGGGLRRCEAVCLQPCGGAIPLCMIGEFDLPMEIVDRKVTKMKMISPSNREVDVGKTLSEREYIGMCRREVCLHCFWPCRQYACFAGHCAAG